MTRPTPISPAERALIDAAIAAGRRTVCPPCRFSEPGEPSAEDRARHRRAARAVSLRRASGDRQRHRQREVARLHGTGATIDQIAARFAVAPGTIENDLADLRRRGEL